MLGRGRTPNGPERGRHCVGEGARNFDHSFNLLNTHVQKISKAICSHYCALFRLARRFFCPEMGVPSHRRCMRHTSAIAQRYATPMSRYNPPGEGALWLMLQDSAANTRVQLMEGNILRKATNMSEEPNKRDETNKVLSASQ